MRLPSALVLLLTSTLTPACADPKFGGTSDTGDTAETDTGTTPTSNLAQVHIIEGHWVWYGNGDGTSGDAWAYGVGDQDVTVSDSVILVLFGQSSGSLNAEYETVRGSESAVPCDGAPNQSFAWTTCFQVMATPE